MMVTGIAFAFFGTAYLCVTFLKAYLRNIKTHERKTV